LDVRRIEASSFYIIRIFFSIQQSRPPNFALILSDLRDSLVAAAAMEGAANLPLEMYLN